jgi:hypothetical protein
MVCFSAFDPKIAFRSSITVRVLLQISHGNASRDAVFFFYHGSFVEGYHVRVSKTRDSVEFAVAKVVAWVARPGFADVAEAKELRGWLRVSPGSELQLNNAAPGGDSDSMGAVACAELLHDVFHVGFYSFFRDKEPVCDIAVAISARGLPQNINFTIRQFFIAEVFSHRGGNLCGHAFVASMHLPDDVRYLSRRHTFKNVGTSASLKGVLDRAIALKRRHNNDPGVRGLGLDGYHRVDSAHVWQSQVHHSNVWLQLSELLDCVAAIQSLSN